jgi:signal peptidase I
MKTTPDDEAGLPAAPAAPSSTPDDGMQRTWPTEPAGAPPERRSRWRFVRELPFLVVVAFGLALLLKTFLLQAFYIPSASMEPTLHGCPDCRGDRVLVNKLVYRLRDPQRGDIVVFVAQPDTQHRNWLQRIVKNLGEGLGARTPPETDFIKRVIALPGETISIKDAVVTIKTPAGRTFSLDEPYISPNKDLSPFGPFKVPPHSYFLLGDNRADSADSRVNTFGGLCAAPPCAVPKSRIVGRAFITIWPLNRLRLHRLPEYPGLAGLLGRLLLGLRAAALSSGP